MKFSVIVPVYNAMQYLPTSMPALLAAVSAHRESELIFIDNESRDGSLEYLQRAGGSAKVATAPGTVGALRNLGAKLASGDCLAFVDADCLVASNYLQQAAEVLIQTGADATGSIYALPDRPHWIEKTWQELHERTTDGIVRHLNAGNFVVRRYAFDAAGGFDSTLTSGEDAELCLRLVNAGFVIHASRRVRAIHLGNPKTMRQFLLQQLWHGLGMFGTLRRSVFDRPVLMMSLHAVLIAFALVLLTISTMTWPLRLLIATSAILTVPAATVAFRAAQRRRLSRPIRSLVLYSAYYLARLAALILIAVGRDRRIGRDLARNRSASQAR